MELPHDVHGAHRKKTAGVKRVGTFDLLEMMRSNALAFIVWLTLRTCCKELANITCQCQPVPVEHSQPLFI